MTLIIGLGSKARQGKDLAAQAILDYYDNKSRQFSKHGLKPVTRVQRIGFADALYEVARNEYGMTEKDAPLLQRIGHERRQQDENYWIKRAFEKILPTTDIVIIPDTRYKNEAVCIKDQGGYVVSVERYNQDGSRFIANDRPANHPSEIDLDDWNFDFRLINSHGHQALLAEQSVTLVEYLRGLQS